MNKARLIQRAMRVPGGTAVVHRLRATPLWPRLAGCYRPFPTLAEAREAAATAGGGGHEDPANIGWHDEHLLRPSDYAAMVHIQPMLPRLRRVFDAGGNIGNLFYAYRRYLDFPPDLVWQVHDLPATIAAGERLAQGRGITQLRFTPNWADADGADLLIASGSLHYFDRPLPELVAALPNPPPAILINRTPLTDGPAIATVQDGGTFRVACMVHNRESLLRSAAQLGYACRDEWPALELALQIPGYPEHSTPHYTGLFLTRRPPTTDG